VLGVLEAVKSRFDADAELVAAFAGGFHLDEAPADAALPLLLAGVVSAQTRQTYGGGPASRVVLRLVAVGEGAASTCALADLVASKWDDATLEPHGASLRRLGGPLPRKRGTSPAGAGVWGFEIDYEFEAEG